MAMIAATCASIVAALASAPGGSTIKLSGDCPAIAVTRSYQPVLTVDAGRATVRGLTVLGSGLVWKGGTIRAAAGMDAKGAPGYGALVRGRDISFVGVTFTDANRGMVIDQAADIKVQSSRFVALRTDGIIASNSRNLEITKNEFSGSLPRATTCNLSQETQRGLSKRICVERGGQWQDGDHPDAIQMRDAIVGALIGWNRIEGETQGIGQMDAPTDRPLANIKVVGNYLRATSGHSITLTNCEGCTISDNDIARLGPGKTLVRFKPELTKACGNRVADGGPGRERCSK